MVSDWWLGFPLFSPGSGGHTGSQARNTNHKLTVHTTINARLDMVYFVIYLNLKVEETGLRLKDSGVLL